MKANPTIIAASELKETKRETVAFRAWRSFAAIVSSLLLAGTAAYAQVNSGSNGSDGAFNPTTNIVINMADHPDGIYQYTSVSIPAGVTSRSSPMPTTHQLCGWCRATASLEAPWMCQEKAQRVARVGLAAPEDIAVGMQGQLRFQGKDRVAGRPQAAALVPLVAHSQPPELQTANAEAERQTQSFTETNTSCLFWAAPVAAAEPRGVVAVVVVVPF